MSHIGSWIVGALVGVLALLGLYLAAHAIDAAMYGTGLALFAFSVLFDFWLVKRAFDAG